ncbi:hypothetical protein CERSUDRAFT_91985 [Gelatoporia subvermispora B]|uniref:Uncharacterized protein n=1 Tax=Ceriporiopsis subvermispora (strain B) TaxID=914234 RepID=M2RLY9_CERS8|nr:hypothetical protein CERSUDRAFT_91985 [Gelatoporia subvermispora B]
MSYACRDQRARLIGTVYFMIVLSINIIQTAGNATNIFTNTVVFNTPITSIIISRFLLNLRGVAYKQRGDGIDDSCPPFVMEQNNHEHEHDRPGSDNLRFASFIGNMGAELYYAGEDYDDKDHRNPSNVESDPEGINLQEHRDIQIGPQEDSSKITLPDRGKTSSTV